MNEFVSGLYLIGYLYFGPVLVIANLSVKSVSQYLCRYRPTRKNYRDKKVSKSIRHKIFSSRGITLSCIKN
jgi:hypothetical protein